MCTSNGCYRFFSLRLYFNNIFDARGLSSWDQKKIYSKLHTNSMLFNNINETLRSFQVFQLFYLDLICFFLFMAPNKRGRAETNWLNPRTKCTIQILFFLGNSFNFIHSERIYFIQFGWIASDFIRRDFSFNENKQIQFHRNDKDQFAFSFIIAWCCLLPFALTNLI